MEIREYGAYDEEEILSLYKSVGWIAYTDHPAVLKAGFAGSLLCLGAYEGEGLIGLLRAVGDGQTVVLIQDVLVRPEYQGRGVGRALLETALDRFRSVRQVQLLTDDRPETVAFYEALGFKPVNSFGCKAFLRG